MVSTTIIGYVRSPPYTWYIANEASPTGFYFVNNADGSAVRSLASAMAQGKAETLRVIDAGNILDLRGLTSEDVYSTMFRSADVLQYVAEIAYTATGEAATLDTELEAAGEALLEILPLALYQKLVRALDISNAPIYEGSMLQAENDSSTAEMVLGGGDSPDFSMTFTNSLTSKVGQDGRPVPGETFSLQSADWNKAPVVVRIISQPAQSLPPFDSESLGWEEIGSNMTVGPTEGYIIWQSTVNSAISFGVKIKVPVQVFHMGYSPYWQVCYNTPTEKKDWFSPGAASVPYTFPDAIGYKINCTPTAGGITLSVKIEIFDKAT